MFDVAVDLDADLAILGAEKGVYDGYAEAIRREYAHVPDEEFSDQRACVTQVWQRLMAPD